MAREADINHPHETLQALRYRAGGWARDVAHLAEMIEIYSRGAPMGRELIEEIERLREKAEEMDRDAEGWIYPLRITRRG